MRLVDLVAAHRSPSGMIVDATAATLDLSQDLADVVRHVDRAHLSELTLGPADLVLLLAGPNAPLHAGLEDLPQLLTVASQAIVLLAWPVDALPAADVCDAICRAGARVVTAVSVEASPVGGADLAVVVARRPAQDGGTVEDTAPVGPGHGMAEVVAAQIATMAMHMRELEHDLNRSEAAARKAQAALRQLERSTAQRVGRAVVAGVRHPGRAALSLPADLLRAYRAVRRHEPAQEGRRAVPIELPVGGSRHQLLLHAPADLLVPRMLAETGLGGYEPSAMACYLAALDVAGPGAVLDIGANIGIYAAIAAAMSPRQVVAFEPTPSLAAVASTFSDENHLEFRAEMIALGAESGTATFYLSDRSDASNSLAAGFRPSSNQIQVPVETLDSYVERTGLVPAVMKVDTETTEPDVLAGSAATIATHRPWILCEVLARRVEPRLEQTLAPHRYHWYPIEVPAPYREAGRIRGDRKYQNLMWLFAPERPGDEFWTALERRTAQLRECRPQRGASPRR